jgi:hypothetical protein
MKRTGRPKTMQRPVKMHFNVDKTIKSAINEFCMKNGKTIAQFMREAVQLRLRGDK